MNSGGGWTLAVLWLGSIVLLLRRRREREEDYGLLLCMLPFLRPSPRFSFQPFFVLSVGRGKGFVWEGPVLKQSRKSLYSEVWLSGDKLTRQTDKCVLMSQSTARMPEALSHMTVSDIPAATRAEDIMAKWDKYVCNGLLPPFQGLCPPSTLFYSSVFLSSIPTLTFSHPVAVL